MGSPRGNSRHVEELGTIDSWVVREFGRLAALDAQTRLVRSMSF
jgi:hypothetical protein